MAKPVKFTTPKGIAVYPHLHKPDEKFSPVRYKTDLKCELSATCRVNGKKGSTEDLVAVMEDMLEEGFQERLEEFEDTDKYGEIFKDELPFFEEDGQMIFRLTLKRDGKNTKTNETWENKPVFVDAKGKPIVNPPKIGGGSVLRVSFEAYVWDMPETEGRGKNKVTNLKVGISLRLKGVQILEIHHNAGQPTAEDMGFEEEEGFEYNADEFENDPEEAGDGSDF